jgi:hypothetical protein
MVQEKIRHSRSEPSDFPLAGTLGSADVHQSYPASFRLRPQHGPHLRTPKHSMTRTWRLCRATFCEEGISEHNVISGFDCKDGGIAVDATLQDK